MFTNNFDPVLLDLGFIDIRWYSLSYIFGIIFGWVYLNTYIIETKETKKDFDNYISYLIIGIIIGGRLGYVFLYNFNYYINNIIEILYIWNGGMSFHGGLVGVILSGYFYSKKNNSNIFKYLDLVALVAPIGIFFGRLSNFINSELYGRQTDVFWGVKFIKVDDLIRHPSQVYEAIFEGLFLFLILNFFFKNYISRSGYISAIFLILYSVFRFIIEFTREPDEHLGFLFLNITYGQFLCIFTLLGGLYIFYLCHEKKI